MNDVYRVATIGPYKESSDKPSEIWLLHLEMRKVKNGKNTGKSAQKSQIIKKIK